MAEYASVEDVDALWSEGQVTEENRSFIELLVKRAEMMLRRRVPDLDARVSSGRLTAEEISWAVADIVLRVLRSPGVYTQQSAGPFSAVLNIRLASGLLEVLDSDLAVIGVSAKKAYTLQLRRFV